MDNTVGFYPSNGSSILSRRTNQASMVKLVDTGDLKSPAFGRAGSNPATRTIFFMKKLVMRVIKYGRF